MANANISTVATTNTFDDWRVATNNLIEDRNQLRNAPYVKDESNFVVANGELRISRTTNGTLLRVEGTANAYIGYNLEVGSNIAVGNIAASRNISTGNLSVTQNTSTGNLRVTTVANVGSLAILGFGPIIDSSGAWLGSTSGLQGLQGPQGASGVGGTGAQGAQGLLGRQGTQGTSIQGVQGTTGSSTQGAQGTSIQGVQGVQGPAGGGGGGSQGAQGTLGSQGSQGTLGSQGAQGLQGTLGSQGTQGLSIQGLQGATGGGSSGTLTSTSSTTDEPLYLTGVNALGSSQTIKSNTRIYMNASPGILYAVDFSASSDERLKKDIVTITEALSSLDSINGVRYFWKDESYGKTQQIGVIAQEVEKVIPEAVTTGANGYKSVSYDRIIPLLIQSIKELKDRVEELEKR